MNACRDCSGPIDPRRDYRVIYALERRSQGANRRSGHDVVLRKVYKPETWVCWSCVESERRREKQGVAVNQMSLGGEAA